MQRRDSACDWTGEVSQSLPDARVENTQSRATRFGKFNEQYSVASLPDMAAGALEGSCFVVQGFQLSFPTAAAPTTFQHTGAYASIYNSANPANPAAPSIILDYFALVCSAAGTGGNLWQFVVTLDQGTRWVSGGTDFTGVIANPNGLAPAQKSVAQIRFGALTLSAATGAVRMPVGLRSLKGNLINVNDSLHIKFGSVDQPNYMMTGTGGFPTFGESSAPPLVIPAGWSAMVHLVIANQSAATSFIPELCWRER